MARHLLVILLSWMFVGCAENSDPPADFPSGESDKIVFVNYWAEWCKPCRDEIPELNDFWKENAEDVVLYGVNFDGVEGEALALLEENMGIEFPTLSSNPGPLLGWPIPEGLPYTMVTDGEGKRLIQLPGKQTMESLHHALEQFRQLARDEGN